MLKLMTGMVTAGVLLLSTINIVALGEDAQHRALINGMKNKVEIKYGESLWREASMNQLVRPGTSIRTGALSRAELIYPDGTITRVGSRTNFTVLDKSFRAVKVERGKLWFKVTKKSYGLKIYSPTAVAAITGTEGFAQVGGNEPDDEKSSANPKNTRIASNDPNFSNKIAEGETNMTFSFGLEEGSANVYKVDVNGEPMGDPTAVGIGQLLTFTDGNFMLENLGPEVIHNQNNDVSEPDQVAGGNPSGEALGPDNVVTEEIPNNPNGAQDLNTSPTTGDLEIIIK
jgi:hypothetical protein